MLQDFLAKNECKTLEFKENTHNIKGILKTIVAFANTAGGVILIGIKDKTKEIIGLSNPLKEEERLTSAINDSISPLIIPDIEFCSYRGRELLIIRVHHMAGPFFIKKAGPTAGVYIRFGSTDRKADLQTINSLHLFASNKSFDEQPSLCGSINQDYLKTIFMEVNKKPNQKQCEMLGIYANHSGKIIPSIGGVLLFSEKRTDVLPDSVIRCACFQGTSKAKILDAHDIYSPLPTSIDAIINFIERNSKKEFIIGKIRRTEILEYPPEAVREIILNALMHADYSMKGSQIQVALFSDRLEVTNPGGLPFGQTMKKALSGFSRLRNHVIGRVFRELQLVEQWGSGLQRIREICEKLGLKTPTFLEENNHFRVTIYSLKQESAIISKNEKQLLNYLKKHGAIQTNEAAKLWRISDRAARTRLAKMTQEGLLIRVSTSDKDPKAVYIPSKQCS